MLVNTAHIFKDVSQFFLLLLLSLLLLLLLFLLLLLLLLLLLSLFDNLKASLFPDHFLMVAKNTGGFATLLQDIITSSLCRLDSFSCYYKLASCNIYLCHAVVTLNILSERDHRLLYIVCFF